jgi:hypothetical protein
MDPMGFCLWVDHGLAWAQGTYEYRPMGTAVISATDLFRRRDFDARRKVQMPATAEFVGRFASLGHLNAHLQGNRKQRGRYETRRSRLSP